MNKAKLTLIVLTFISLAGGLLAFKAQRFSAAAKLWTLNGQYTTLTTFTDERTFYTTLAICVTTSRWASTTGSPANVLTTSWALVPFYATTTIPPFTYTTLVPLVMCFETSTFYTTIEP